MVWPRPTLLLSNNITQPACCLITNKTVLEKSRLSRYASEGRGNPTVWGIQNMMGLSKIGLDLTMLKDTNQWRTNIPSFRLQSEKQDRKRKKNKGMRGEDREDEKVQSKHSAGGSLC